MTELDCSAGSPPTRGVYIAKVDPTPRAGCRGVALFTAPEAAGYKAPFQKG